MRIEELRRVAFFDIRELFDARGHLKNIKTLPAEVASALASAEVVRTNMISGDGKREWLHKVRAVDEGRARNAARTDVLALPPGTTGSEGDTR